MNGILSDLNILALNIAPVFYKLVFMSLTAVFIGTVIVLLRKIFDKKISPVWKFLMWGLVVLALLVPYRPQSEFSMVDDTKKVEDISFRNDYDMASYELKMASQNETNSIEIRQEKFIEASKKEKSLYTKSLVFDVLIPLIWLVGMIVFAMYLMFSRFRFVNILTRTKGLVVNSSSARISVSPANAMNGDEFGFTSNEPVSRLEKIFIQCKDDFDIERGIRLIVGDKISSPAITGLFRPTILLPNYCLDMSDESLAFVIYHELGHYKRGDIFANTVLVLLQVFYWFNPLVWLMFKLVRDDMEVLNDDYVISSLGSDKAKAYARSLVEVLGLTNGISLMPRLLCMVDDKKNIERRIGMIKEGKNFKKRRLIIALVSMAIIVVLGVAFLTTRPKEHRISIYAIDRVKPDVRLDSLPGLSSDLQSKYKEEYRKIKLAGMEPKITGKDIVGYNEKLRIFVLSEEFREEAKKKAGREADPMAFGGSVYMGVTNGKKMASGDFIIAVDDEFVYGGSLDVGMLSSMSTFSPMLIDVYDGIMISSRVWDEGFNIDDTRLIAALKDMDIPMDAISPSHSLHSEGVYDTKRLWDNRTDFDGDDAKIEGLISAMPLPTGTKYESFEKDLDLYIHKARNYSPNLNGLRIFLSGMRYKDDKWTLEKDARILFALVDGLDFVEFVEDNGSDAPAIKGFVDSRNKELTDPIMRLSSNVYEMIYTGDKKLASVEELFLYLEPFVIFGNQTDYPYLVGAYSHQKEVDVVKSHDLPASQKSSLPTEVYVYEPSGNVVAGTDSNDGALTYVIGNGNNSVSIKKASSIDGDDIEIPVESGNPILTKEGIIFDVARGEKRELSAEELDDFNNRVFRVSGKMHDGSTYSIMSRLSFMLSSYYDKVEDINIADLVFYLSSPGIDDRLSPGKEEDKKEFELLKQQTEVGKEVFGKFTLENWITPVRRIRQEDVEDILQKYGNISLDELSGVGSEDVLYLPEYGYFYSYSSDAKDYSFRADSGEIDGDELTLYWHDKQGMGKTAMLKLVYDDEKAIWYIKSHTEE